MNLKCIITTAGCLALASVHADSVLVHNTTEAEDGAHALFTEQGALLSAAIPNNVRLGTFAEGFDIGSAWNSGNLNALESNFLRFDQSSGLFADEDMNGLLQAMFTSGSAAFTNRPIVLWIAASEDFLDPFGQHLIFQFDATFNTTPGTLQVMALKPSAGELLVGQYGNYSHDYGFGSGNLQGFNLAGVVPEPSTYALLIGSVIGAISLLRRRKA